MFLVIIYKLFFFKIIYIIRPVVYAAVIKFFNEHRQYNVKNENPFSSQAEDDSDVKVTTNDSDNNSINNINFNLLKSYLSCIVSLVMIIITYYIFIYIYWF